MSLSSNLHIFSEHFNSDPTCNTFEDETSMFSIEDSWSMLWTCGNAFWIYSFHICEQQVDQGLGIGTQFPFFNRHQLTLARFIQLMSMEEGAGKPPPPVLVLHDRYGGCVGDLPSYDAFTLGGPRSVRENSMGEPETCWRLELLASFYDDFEYWSIGVHNIVDVDGWIAS